jgi:hypothetical protein
VAARRLGETLVLRYWKAGGLVGALPARVVAPDRRVIWVAPGTPVKWPGVGGDRLSVAGRRSAHPGASGSRALDLALSRHRGLVRPTRGPLAARLDTEDHALDVVVEPNGSWWWKDEDELTVAVEVGFFTPAQAARISGRG